MLMMLGPGRLRMLGHGPAADADDACTLMLIMLGPDDRLMLMMDKC